MKCKLSYENVTVNHNHSHVCHNLSKSMPLDTSLVKTLSNLYMNYTDFILFIQAKKLQEMDNEELDFDVEKDDTFNADEGKNHTYYWTLSIDHYILIGWLSLFHEDLMTREMQLSRDRAHSLKDICCKKFFSKLLHKIFYRFSVDSEYGKRKHTYNMIVCIACI